MADGPANIAALNASSGWQGSQTPAALGFDPEAQANALDELAAAFDGAGPIGDEDSVESGALGLPRIVVLDALVKLATRGEGISDAVSAKVDALLAAIAKRARVPLAQRPEAVGLARAGLGSAAGPRPPGVDAWAAFAAEAAAPLRLTRFEVEKPRCVAQAVTKPSHGGIAALAAQAVTVDFYTDTAPGAMLDFCNPEEWHRLSVYQGEMGKVELPGALEGVQLENGWWRRDRTETVHLAPGAELVTPLRFSYSVDQMAQPRWVHLDYALFAGTDAISVDEGSLDVRLVAGGRRRGKTRVIAKKAVRFENQILREWTTIACDTLWTDTVIAAAVCASDGGA